MTEGKDTSFFRRFGITCIYRLGVIPCPLNLSFSICEIKKINTHATRFWWRLNENKCQTHKLAVSIPLYIYVCMNYNCYGIGWSVYSNQWFTNFSWFFLMQKLQIFLLPLNEISGSDYRLWDHKYPFMYL